MKEIPFERKITDRRVQKTRKLLHEALMSLVLEKNYDFIIVQEILDRANVGRSTFYMHFRDKDELLVNGLESVRDLLHNAQKPGQANFSAPYERVIGFSSALFEHIHEYRHVWKALIHTSAGFIVRQHLEEIISSQIRRQFRIELQKQKVFKSRIPSELIVHYLASTFLSVMSWWLDSPQISTPESIDEIYRALVTPGLKSIFEATS